MKALILTWEKYQDHELIYPYYSLKEYGLDVTLAANQVGKIWGILGTHMPCDLAVSDLEDPEIRKHYLNYDLLVVPGGVKALEKLRQKFGIIQFISDWNKSRKVISSTCHGAQLLISAKVTKDRRITGYPSLKDDLENSGATYLNNEVVIDENIISSPHYDHMGLWMEKTLEVYEQI